MMTVQFYNYLAAVEVQPQSVATPTHKFTRARYSFDRCCTTSGTNVNRPGQILQIRDCPGDSGTVGAYECGSANTGSDSCHSIRRMLEESS